MLLKLKPLIIVLSIVLIIIVAVKVIFTYTDIKSTFKQPDLIINNIEDLKDFSKQVSEGKTFKDKLVILNKDIKFDINEENNFKPIGKIEINPPADGKSSPDYSNYFQGTFDGKNHIISGVNINISDGYYIGLFSRLVLESEVRNVILKDSIIQSKSATTGSIVGSVYESKLINCYSNTTLNTYTEESNSVGGIVGSTVYKSEINSCCFEGKMNIDTYLTHSGAVGGIAGYSGEFSEIVNCYNNSNSNINILDEHPSEIKNEYKNDEPYGNLRIGGLVGSNDPGLKLGAYILNSYYTGAMNFSFKDNADNINIPALRVGGISGYNKYVIENCYNAGQINNYGGYATISDTVESYINAKITNCYYIDIINAPEINTIISSRDANFNPQIDINKLTSEEMKSKKFLDKLNQKAKEQKKIRVKGSLLPWRYRTKTLSWHIDSEINDGYPILSNINYNR